MEENINGGLQKGSEILVTVCSDMQRRDRVLIVSNVKTSFIADCIEKQAKKITDTVSCEIIPEFSMHGQEPPEEISQKMLNSDVIFALTKKSMAHTQACKNAINSGAKYLSLPDYSKNVIESAALIVDFKKLLPVTLELANILTNGSEIEITSEIGTSLKCDIRKRKGNAAPGYCYQPGIIASPPDIESNIALVEDGSNGVLVVDGSIPCDEIGKLDSPITLIVKEGRVVDIRGHKAQILQELFDGINNPKTRILAEFGIGLNPKARLKGEMLEDEGTYGTIHIGIGANIVLGGINSVPFHLDHVIKDPTVKIDGDVIIFNGKLIDKYHVQ